MAEPARQILQRLQQWRVHVLLPWRARAMAIGACVSLAAAFAGFLPFLWRSQEAIDLSLLFWARGARPAPPEVILVPIDGRAARSLFLPAAHEAFERCADVRREALPGYKNPDPPDVLTRWPRCLHARALETLAAAQPAAVVMDISFRPRSDPGQVFAEQDQRLALAMRELGTVVLTRRIRLDESPEGAAQPIAREIEAAALATAPFLIVGDRLQRADRFCTFMDASPWSGPCLPVVVHQLATLELYAEFHRLLGMAGSRNTDLIPEAPAGLIAQGALQVPVRLMRHLATAELESAARLKATLAVQNPGIDAVALARLADIYTGSGTRYFNFYGPPGSFRILRYESLVAATQTERLERDSLRGKIVFIGFGEHETPEAVEHFATPFTTAESIKLSGVELAATAYANLRDGSAVEAPPAWSRALAGLAAGVLCTLFCVVVRPALALALGLACAAAYFAGAVAVFEHSAAWLPLVLPLGIAAPAALGAGLAARFVEMKRERDYRGAVISLIFPPSLVRRIVDEHVELDKVKELVPGVCISTDIRDFTAFAEDRSPDEVLSVLEDYFTRVKQVTLDYKADSIDIAGDGMMAVWADRARDPALRRRLCGAALEIHAAAECFRRSRPELRRLRTRIGIHYGPVDLAMMGGPSHKQYRGVGDTTNTAQRVQSLNKPLGTLILVSEPVIRGIDGFLTRDLGHFLLQGKRQPTQIYQLVDFERRAMGAKRRRCEIFAAGLAAYRRDAVGDAKVLFDRFSRTDRASAYYARLCAKGYLQQEPLALQ